MNFINTYRYEKSELWRVLTTSEIRTIEHKVQDRRTKTGYRIQSSYTFGGGKRNKDEYLDGIKATEERVKHYYKIAEGIAFINFNWVLRTLKYYKFIVPWFKTIFKILAPMAHLITVLLLPWSLLSEFKEAKQLSVFSKIILTIYMFITWLLYLAIESAIVLGIIVFIKHLL